VGSHLGFYLDPLASNEYLSWFCIYSNILWIPLQEYEPCACSLRLPYSRKHLPLIRMKAGAPNINADSRLLRDDDEQNRRPPPLPSSHESPSSYICHQNPLMKKPGRMIAIASVAWKGSLVSNANSLNDISRSVKAFTN